MNYSSEIGYAQAEITTLDHAVEVYREANGPDRKYRLMRIKLDRTAARERELQRQAAQEFAALNGWR